MKIKITTPLILLCACYFYVIFKNQSALTTDISSSASTFYQILGLVIPSSILILLLRFKKIQPEILTLLGSIILSLIGFEVVLNKYDIIRAPKVIQTHHKRSTSLAVPNAVPSLFPNLFFKTNGLNQGELFPLGGISNRVTRLCNETEMIYYKSDRYGFNNPDNTYEKDGKSILLIGDSFTHGACVDQNFTIAGNLRRLNPNEKIINLGMSGNGLLAELASLKEYGQHFQPKEIIWFYYEGNDIGNTFQEYESEILRKYLENNNLQNLISKQERIDQLLYSFVKAKKQEKQMNKRVHQNPPPPLQETKVFNFKQILKLKKLFSITTPFLFSVDMGKRTQMVFEKIFKSVSQIAEKKNINLIFVFLPDPYRVLTKPIYKKGYTENLFKLVRQHGFTRYAQKLWIGA